MAGEASRKREGVTQACPLCHSQMEMGYVVAKMISWSDKKISNFSLRGLWSGEMIVSGDYPFPIKNMEGYRCRSCKLIIFKC